ncbi:swi5-dependent recombination DNA repair protein 1 homolog [Brienomyrus brachyistius]|uniref:swi5-dependent recombination DNA repair protein 1 homolog n=1 Tax=Brienomyrus brachyistius TaxID=42636 RepID=UPI0020B37EEB|nr:swi5-dependent recombination DNA repair protein 1 homolog [Brienomyrus brachyistius]
METPNALKSKPVNCTPESSVNAGPSGCKTPKPMSASLRDRLKRSRRSFNAPLSVAKRLKVDPEEDIRTDSAGVKETENTGTSNNVFCERDHQTDIDINRNQTGKPATREGAQESEVPGNGREPEQSGLLQLRETLRREVREKTEILRRLKMAKMYRRKNDLTQLTRLIHKWRHCCQAVLYELQVALPINGQAASLSQLLDHLGLEDHVLHFDRSEENFRD